MIKKLVVYSVLYVITCAILCASVMLKPHELSSPAISILRTVIVIFASILLTKYFLYMFLGPFHNLMVERERDLIRHFVPEYKPLVSVLVPAFNEECGLLGTIRSLLNNTYRNMEVIVVNDGSTDKSDAMMRAFIVKYERELAEIPSRERISILYDYKENGGKGSALNRAIELSHGEILVSVDADCVVSPACIEAFVEAFKDPRTKAAVGNVKIGNTRSMLGQIQYLEYTMGFYGHKCDSVMGTIYIIGGAAGAFRREVFERFRYSTTNITEDIRLSMDICDMGWKTVYCHDAIVITEGASSLPGLQKQRNRWCRGRLECFLEKRHMFFSLRKHHNKFLTCFVLPLAAFSGTQLLCEPIFISALFLISCLSGDFSGFVSSVIIVWLMFIIQAWDSGDWKHSIWFSGIGWLLFYVITFIELRALTTSIWKMLRGREEVWQRWQRSGAMGR